MNRRNQESQIAPLRTLSARVGGDPLLVQAGTGNTSIKRNGTLWIKASGKWLANAEIEEQFVPVDLSRARDCLRRRIDIAAECVGAASRRLMPSVETAMHSVIPDRVVLHLHSVNTIAWAVRADGPAQLRERLAGLPWRWIPYVPSGKELAWEIEKALAQAPGMQVFILANHGLVVAGESVEAAGGLLQDVERQLHLPPRPAPPPDTALNRLVCGSGWRLPDSTDLHALATDPFSRSIVSQGILYPCEAIFFGADVPAAHTMATFESAAGPFAIIEDAGLVISRTLTMAQHAMLAGLVEVVRRIDPASCISYLTPQEVCRVLNVDASRYRALMDSQCRGACAGSPVSRAPARQVATLMGS